MTIMAISISELRFEPCSPTRTEDACSSALLLWLREGGKKGVERAMLESGGKGQRPVCMRV